MYRLLENLIAHGWTVHSKTGATALLPASVAARYPDLPRDIASFLAGIEVCVNPAQNSWFLSAADYARQPTEAGFRWNEYECMDLESSSAPDERAAVTSFWNGHFPFMLAVHSDYDYLALRLAPEGFGQVVHGYSPYWLEPVTVADTFEDFLRRFSDAASAAEPEEPFGIFL